MHGGPWGAPDDLNTFMAMVNNVPDNWTFSAFSLGRNQMAYVAASVLAGGNVRVGLEDNLMLERGVLAENYQLVEKARRASPRTSAFSPCGSPRASPRPGRALAPRRGACAGWKLAVTSGARLGSRQIRGRPTFVPQELGHGRQDHGRTSWWKAPSARSEDSARAATLDRSKAQAAPTSHGAPLEQLGG